MGRMIANDSESVITQFDDVRDGRGDSVIAAQLMAKEIEKQEISTPSNQVRGHFLALSKQVSRVAIHDVRFAKTPRR